MNYGCTKKKFPLQNKFKQMYFSALLSFMWSFFCSPTTRYTSWIKLCKYQKYRFYLLAAVLLLFQLTIIMKIGTLNIRRGLLKKIDTLEQFANSEKLQILSINESDLGHPSPASLTFAPVVLSLGSCCIFVTPCLSINLYTMETCL